MVSISRKRNRRDESHPGCYGDCNSTKKSFGKIGTPNVSPAIVSTTSSGSTLHLLSNDFSVSQTEVAIFHLLHELRKSKVWMEVSRERVYHVSDLSLSEHLLPGQPEFCFSPSCISLTDAPLIILHRLPLWGHKKWFHAFWSGAMIVGLRLNNDSCSLADRKLKNKVTWQPSLPMQDAALQSSVQWVTSTVLVRLQSLRPWLLYIARAAVHSTVKTVSTSLLSFIHHRSLQEEAQSCNSTGKCFSILSEPSATNIHSLLPGNLNGHDWYRLDEEESLLEGLALFRNTPRVVVEAIALRLPVSSGHSSSSSYNAHVREHWRLLLTFINQQWLPWIAVNSGILKDKERGEVKSSALEDYSLDSLCEKKIPLPNDPDVAELLLEGLLDPADDAAGSVSDAAYVSCASKVFDDGRKIWSMPLLSRLWCAIRFLDRSLISSDSFTNKSSDLASKADVGVPSMAFLMKENASSHFPPYCVVPFFLLCRSLTTELGTSALHPSIKRGKETDQVPERRNAGCFPPSFLVNRARLEALKMLQQISNV